LTPDRTTESLFEELVLNGIIKSYPKVRMKEYLGEISYTGMTLKAKAGAKDPEPGGGDVRRAITEYCILPMSRFHKMLPNNGYIVVQCSHSLIFSFFIFERKCSTCEIIVACWA
jgi:hypothetical protein